MRSDIGAKSTNREENAAVLSGPLIATYIVDLI